MMKMQYKQVSDPVFESVMRHGGAKPIEISVTHPDEYEEFLKESDMLNRRAEKATDACVDSVVRYSLLTDPHAVFSSCLRVAQTHYNLQRSFDSNSDAEVRARSAKSKKWIIDAYNAAMLSLEDEKEKLEVVYRGQGTGGYTRPLISDAVKGVASAVVNVGEYGRIEVCTHIIGKLDSLTRKARPEAGLFIDLLIKGMLINDPSMKVRRASWNNSDLKESDTLRRADVLGHIPSNEALNKYNIKV